MTSSPISIPSISVITVTYNAEQYLEKTIQSVLSQDYEDIEYIIIDGGSTDSTVDIIKQYESEISYWVTEPDNGIYDAMNKGIEKASGKWINFMNAGDVFFDENVLSEFFAGKQYDAIILYGDVVVDYGGFQKYLKAGGLESLWKGMQFSHQSCFIDSSYHKKNPYTLEYRAGGDFDFFYKAYVDGIAFQHLDCPISKTSSGGLSDVNQSLVVSHWKDIVLFYTPSLKHRVYYFYRSIDVGFRNILKSCMPKAIVSLIRRAR